MMSFLTEHIPIWTTAQELKTSNRGRSASNQSLLGIKKLRELILELAVRGKLTQEFRERHPELVSGSHSASELLKKIEVEKRKLIKEGKIKKQEASPEVGENEKPFDLPKGWEWTRLGIIGIGSTGKTPSTNIDRFFDGNIPFIGPGQMLPTGEIIDSDKALTEEGAMHSTIAVEGDILMVCIGGSIGKNAIVKSTITYNQQLNSIHPLFVETKYLYFAMNSPHFQSSIIEKATGSATPIINRSRWEELFIPIPPLAEQHRIVVKVDELMALCEELENQQTNSNAAHETLVATLLGSLTGTEYSNSFDESWQRIANHFDILFTTEHSIDQLKQTILQLAVMGKLTQQNPNDEPAIELLKKIAKEKAQLVKEEKIKKQSPLPEITDDEKPFELPKGWEWTRLGNTSILKGGFAYQSSKFFDDGVCQVIRMGNIRPDYLRLDENPVFISDIMGDDTSEYRIESDDILLTMTGTKGKRDYLYSLIITPDHLLDRKLFLNQRLCIVRTFIFPRFQNMVIKSDRLLDVIYVKSTGTANQANIGMSAINEWVIPIPSLAEQQRIVCKVDELFALCDALKERLVEAQTLQNQLAVAVVEQGLN